MLAIFLFTPDVLGKRVRILKSFLKEDVLDFLQSHHTSRMAIYPWSQNSSGKSLQPVKRGRKQRHISRHSTNYHLRPVSVNVSKFPSPLGTHQGRITGL